MDVVVLSPQRLVVKLNAVMAFADSMLTLWHGERKWRMTHPPCNIKGDWKKKPLVTIKRITFALYFTKITHYLCERCPRVQFQ